MAEVDNKVPAEVRTQFGKGFARRLRVAGQIPAVVYGHGAEVLHIAVPARQVTLLLRKKNAILDLQIDGKSTLALVKDVQKDPVRQIVEHIDLVVVTKGEKVVVNVPIHVVGTQQSGSVLELDAKTVHLEAEATHIPEFIEVNIEGAVPGFRVTLADLKLPADVKVDGSTDQLVVHVHAAGAKDKAETGAELAAELADEAAHAEHKAEIHAEQHDAEKAAVLADAELSGAAAAAEAAE
ncbi:large subunit ribosomal protein L25 [Aurantimicrobium minutum]|uniref:50S ribosomal protein L25/general stress protein Ctc n=1 Tax=Aurantimicrobium minutum TaxID=708131 RepID=UPI002406749F|nr:50S ribosomal protein L25/general stress protein Ctc [Aurantimicrobium minutum]MDF9809730.1 large subunit ribosomal protein L25 [Aurantimicrobium minutum]